jgi:hypothetical protein
MGLAPLMLLLKGAITFCSKGYPGTTRLAGTVGLPLMRYENFENVNISCLPFGKNMEINACAMIVR